MLPIKSELIALRTGLVIGTSDAGDSKECSEQAFSCIKSGYSTHCFYTKSLNLEARGYVKIFNPNQV